VTGGQLRRWPTFLSGKIQIQVFRTVAPDSGSSI
jgi:hypothetical protein